MNLTDAEVIKALECCVRSTSRNDCEKLHCPACKDFGCHYMDISDRDDSYEALIEGLGKAVLDLINRQQAEIEKLKKIEHFADKTIEKQSAEIERLQHEILSCNTKIEVLQEVKEQLEKDVFNAQMNCDSIAYDYELLKQEKSVVQSEAIKEFAERLIHEIVNRPSKIQSASEEYLCGSAYRQNEIIDIVKELESNPLSSSLWECESK